MRPLPILVAGPTASGKSAIALKLAALTDGLIVNADALQVYDCWKILTARPNPEDCEAHPHLLYGHVSRDIHYSAGAWLRDLQASVFDKHSNRQLIIVGGSGLYFSTLTNGLAEIPPIPDDVRNTGNQNRVAGGAQYFLDALQTLDPNILKMIDTNNPARLQRAWEVAVATGKPLSRWWNEPTNPLLPPEQAICVTIQTDPQALRERMDKRFDWMLENGALEECQAMISMGWDPNLPSSRALGATELIAYLSNELSLEEATQKAKTATHQYAKRQRTWFRNRMSNWHQITAETPADSILILPAG